MDYQTLNSLIGAKRGVTLNFRHKEVREIFLQNYCYSSHPPYKLPFEDTTVAIYRLYDAI
jgi:hypothetical protein